MTELQHAAEMRRCLEELDVEGARKLWRHIAPQLPQPGTPEQALVTLHCARTSARSLPFKLRAYSHAWLRERGLPSNLPDQLKPAAERQYPVVVGVVGIATAMRSNDPDRREIARQVLSAMEVRVLELYGEGETRPQIVKPEMLEARRKTYRKLLGSTAIPPLKR